MSRIQQIAQYATEQIKGNDNQIQPNAKNRNFKSNEVSSPEQLERIPEKDVVEISKPETNETATKATSVSESDVINCRDSIEYAKTKKGHNYNMTRDDGLNINVKNSWLHGRSFTGTINDKEIDLKYKVGFFGSKNEGKLVGKIDGEEVKIPINFGFHKVQFDANTPEVAKDMLPELALLVTDEIEKRNADEQTMTEAMALYGSIK